VVAEESFNQYLDKAVKYYSSLFMLPSRRNIILFSALVCVVVGLISSISLSLSFIGLVEGLLLGFSLLLVTLFSNYFLSAFVLKQDAVYDLRRTAALSLFSWILWLFFIFVGGVAAVLFGSVWVVRLCLIGFSAVLILRFIVIHVTSSVNYKRFFVASVLQPFLCLVPFTVLWSNTTDFKVIFLFSVYALVVSFLSSFSFIYLVNRVGEQNVGEPSLAILRAFLLNWIADLNAPFEALLERLSEEKDLEVSVARFDGFKPKAVMVVSSVHPGPFKNVGSSLFPSMLKAALEQKFNCVACVPLGLLGHELDLTSQAQNQKVIDYVASLVDFRVSVGEATPFIKVSNGLATACCQIFGKSAIIAFSLAPNTTEDFPQELGFFVRKEAEKCGLHFCIVINAHNSIDGAINPKEALEALKTVAVECMEKAASLARKPFRVGAATFTPKEFTPRDGMGPSGITAIVVEVDKQRAAYIVIDGNNMVSGLREKILSTLRSLGIHEGEIFTTDTHSVNALTLNARGYHPLGEVIDHEKLISYIKEATNTALSNLEPAKVGCRSVKIPKVRVIGQKSLEKLCLLPEKAFKRAKKIVAPLFAATFLFLMLFLLLV
jgi:putative membrane protein